MKNFDLASKMKNNAQGLVVLFLDPQKTQTENE